MIYYSSEISETRKFGGLAQLARASGSYPAGRWFKSDIRYHSRPVGQAVKTRPFHGCNMGSIPVRVTKKGSRTNVLLFFFVSRTHIEHTPSAAHLEYGFAFAARRSESSLLRRRASKYSFAEIPVLLVRFSLSLGHQQKKDTTRCPFLLLGDSVRGISHSALHTVQSVQS